MIRANKAPTRYHGLIGSLVFALLAVVLTYGAFSNAVVLDEQSKRYVVEFVKYQNIIITACVACALIDVLIYKQPASPEKKKSH